jgi:hypothetical protein
MSSPTQRDAQIIPIWRGATDRANKPTGEQIESRAVTAASDYDAA